MKQIFCSYAHQPPEQHGLTVRFYDASETGCNRYFFSVLNIDCTNINCSLNHVISITPSIHSLCTKTPTCPLKNALIHNQSFPFNMSLGNSMNLISFSVFCMQKEYSTCTI